jgi:hypothetical protein
MYTVLTIRHCNICSMNLGRVVVFFIIPSAVDIISPETKRGRLVLITSAHYLIYSIHSLNLKKTNYEYN